MTEYLELVKTEGTFAYYFEEISKIPRGSKNNKKISDYLVQFAIAHNLRYIQDEHLNVIIYKDASKGMEDYPAVIIQGHMDMVCEKHPDSNHDFENDALELIYENGFVYAKDTTLGADDGIALAYALAILHDDTLVHPPIEVLITTDEEIGMDGAFGLDASVLKGKYMLNIDSEDEGIFLSSCAGGLGCKTVIPLSFNEAKGQIFNIKITGLRGGHSGAEIDKKRTNANILMGRVLNELKKKYFRINLCEINGGLKDNAITRQCQAKIIVDERMNNVEAYLNEIFAVIKSELKYSEPEVDLVLDYENNSQSEDMWHNVMSPDCETHVIRYLLIVNDGVMKMSSSIKDLVETSLNLGVLETKEDEISFTHSIRSSIESAKWHIFEKVSAAANSCKGVCKELGQYPGWEYEENSVIRELAVRSYETITGKEAKIEAIHAGLECGVIKSKLPEIDIVSFGPDIMDIHTTEERMNVNSSIRTYELVIDILKNITK